jgi:hypothetical protein
MVQPIDYGVDIPDPTQAFLGAFKTGAAIQEVGLQQQKQQQEIAKQERELARQREIESAFAKISQPGATVDDVANLAMRLPKDQSEAVLKGWELRTDTQKQNALSQAGKIVSALFAGENDIAQQYLNDQAIAKRNSGDEEGAKFLETWRGVTEVNPESSKKFFTAQLLQLPGGDKIVENIIKLQGEQREQEKQPATLAELEAKALEAGIKAEFVRPTAEAELAKLKAETLAPSVREAIDFKNLSLADQAVFQNLQILKKPPAAVTNVNVSNVDKTASGELGKLVPDLYNQMNAAADLTGELARYRTALGTAITGPFAERRLQVAQIANAFGFVGDKGINATRELIQGNAEMALKARSLIAGQGQGPITEGEQALLVRARAGDINFTKGELNTLFNIFDRAAKAQYDQSRKLLQSATTQSPTAQLFLDAAKPFGAQTAPPAQPAAPVQAAPAAQPAQTTPGMPPGFRRIQ